MKPFLVTCSASGCAARDKAELDGAPPGWVKIGLQMYCPDHHPEAAPVESPKLNPFADVALVAVTRLIVDVVQGDDRLRFYKAEKLCRLVSEMRQTLEPRVDDYLSESAETRRDGGFDPRGIQIGEPLPMIGRAVRRWNPRDQQVVGGRLGDQGDILREMMAALGASSESRRQQELADVAAAEAQELAVLLDLHEDDRERFEKRIALLEKRINERGKEDEHEMVHPELERGLRAGEDGRRQDASDGSRPDGT